MHYYCTFTDICRQASGFTESNPFPPLVFSIHGPVSMSFEAGKPGPAPASSQQHRHTFYKPECPRLLVELGANTKA